MTLSRFFKTDGYGNKVVPDHWYSVHVHPRGGLPGGSLEYVSGEELLACAEWLNDYEQTLATQRSMPDDDD